MDDVGRMEVLHSQQLQHLVHPRPYKVIVQAEQGRGDHHQLPEQRGEIFTNCNKEGMLYSTMSGTDAIRSSNLQQCT